VKLVLLQPQLRAFDTVRNLDAIRALLAKRAGELGSGDVVVLPEHFWFDAEGDAPYERAMADLAREVGCWIVGGSHHARRADSAVNAGVAVDPDGAIAGTYEKLRPYADERKRVGQGSALGEIAIAGRRCLVLICADFWFSDLVTRARALPDLVLVPALSVTRKATPGYSRALWRDLAVIRAYEFGVYVGISDWAYPSSLPERFTCGVGGLADTTSTDPEAFFRRVPEDGIGVYDLDFDRLEAFRDDRRARGFFWKER
jgi:predicted amidohydrolase